MTARLPDPVAKLTKLQENLGAQTRAPGSYYIRMTKRGPVMQSWPKKRPKTKTPAQVYREGEFGLAAHWASNPEPGQLEAATIFAQGTTMVPRDFLTAAAFGTIFDFIFEDGTQWVSYRSVTVNSQLVLDQVTDTPGAMLWRSPSGWIEIVPGSFGQVLMATNTGPSFQTYLPPGSTQPLMFGPTSFLATGNTNIPVNNFTGCVTMLQAGTQITDLAVWCGGAAPTAKVIPSIYYSNFPTNNTLVAVGPQKTGLVQGFNRLPLTPPVPIINDGAYLLGITTTVAVWPQPNALTNVPGWTATFAAAPPATLVVTSAGADNTRAKVWALKI